jgi:hypothetical protein
LELGDPLQMATQLLQVTDLKDYPKMIIPLEDNQWQNFWLEEAKKLKSQVLK